MSEEKNEQGIISGLIQAMQMGKGIEHPLGVVGITVCGLIFLAFIALTAFLVTSPGNIIIRIACLSLAALFAILAFLLGWPAMRQATRRHIVGSAKTLIIDPVAFVESFVPSDCNDCCLDQFVKDQLCGLRILAASRHTTENREIPSDLSLSFIVSATKIANFVLSVDFEVHNWHYIIREEDIDQAQARFQLSNRSLSLPDPSMRERFDDFNNLFTAMENRIASEEPRYVWPAPGIMRTFVIKGTRRIDWIRWAILKRLSERSVNHKNRCGKPFVENRVLFIDEASGPLQRSLLQQKDVILFFDVKQCDLRIESHDPMRPSLPNYIAYGIREEFGTGAVDSEVIGQPESLLNAYRYGMKVWNAAEPIDPEKLAGDVQGK